MTNVRTTALAAFLCTLGLAHADAVEPVAVVFPTYGLRLTRPVVSKNIQPAAPGRIATYELPGGSKMLVEIQTAGGKTAAAVAQKFIGKSDAKVEPLGTDVGGEKAVRFEMPMDGAPFTRRLVAIAVHNDYAYVFNVMRTEKEDAGPALAALLKSVRFAPPKPPAGEVAKMSEDAWEVFDRFTIAFAEIVRPVTADATNVHFGIYDYTRPGKLGNPLNIELERIRLPDPKPFFEMRESYSAIMREQFKTAQALVWTVDPRVPGLHSSQPLMTTVHLPDGTEKKVMQRFCILELAKGDLVQIVFAVSDLPAADVAAYNALSDRVLKTIKVKPAAK